VANNCTSIALTIKVHLSKISGYEV
jgi:hypothetical protein